jgi:hypothetical protein
MNISCGAMWLSADRQDSWFMNCDAALKAVFKQNRVPASLIRRQAALVYTL